MTIASKLPEVGTTIFTTMSALAAEHGAVNLSQGYPDFDPHPDLIALVSQYMQTGKNQYAPMQGVPFLRQRIAEKARSLYDAAIDPDTQVTVTSGATEALYAAITAVMHPGDEAVILEPAYDAYAPVILLNQGRPVYVPMSFPDHAIDWQRVQDAFTPKTRLLIINSPHNPSGRVLSIDDIAAIPPSVFYHDRRDHKVLRFCFAKQDKTLLQAAEILCTI
jgi:methionine aminotransferase